MAQWAFFLGTRIDSYGPTIGNSIRWFLLSRHQSVSPQPLQIIASIAQVQFGGLDSFKMKSEKPVARGAISFPARPKIGGLLLKSGLFNQYPINSSHRDCTWLHSDCTWLLMTKSFTWSATVHCAKRWGASEGVYGPKVSKMLWMENAIFMEKKNP